MTPERKQEIKARCEESMSGCSCCELLTIDLPDCLDEIERLRGELRRFEFIFSNKRSKPFRLLHDIARKALEGTDAPD